MTINRILGASFPRKLFRQNLLILCYHGFSALDEHDFKPSMFMKMKTFERRMRLLKDGDWPVLPLGRALEKLQEGTLAPGSIAITIDDGWKRTVDAAENVLFEYDLPATVYVTTHYVEKQFPVSNMTLSYVLWKGKCRMRDLDKGVLARIIGDTKLDNSNASVEEKLRTKANHLDAVGRDNLNREIANVLEVDYDELKYLKLFYLMNRAELRRTEAAGCNLELHGHRHLGGLTANNEDLLRKEVVLNRRALKSVTSRNLKHYCYPSGKFHAQQESWLRSEGIISATTCEPGLNSSRDNHFALRRFLDREDIDDSRFLLEISGIRQFSKTLFDRTR